MPEKTVVGTVDTSTITAEDKNKAWDEVNLIKENATSELKEERVKTGVVNGSN